MAHSTKAESFMRARTRGSPSWPERMLRGRIHYCRLIETNSQKSTCRSGAGHTFGSDRGNSRPNDFAVLRLMINTAMAAGAETDPLRAICEVRLACVVFPPETVGIY